MCREFARIDPEAGKELYSAGFPKLISSWEIAQLITGMRCDMPSVLVLDDFQFMQKELPHFKKLAAEPIDMPHYGLRRYTVKTFEWWLYLYRRHGIEGLKPGYRSDRGKSRRVTEEIALKVQEKMSAKPKLSGTLLYEELKKGVPRLINLAGRGNPALLQLLLT